MSLVVRPAAPADLAAVKAVYDHQVRAGVATFDTVEPPLSVWEERLADDAPGHHLLVAHVESEVEGGVEGGVVGYAHAGTYRPRAAYGRTVETSVYLSPGQEGHGLGRALYDELLARLRADGMHVVLAVIAAPNPASEALHRACGFAEVGRLPEVGYKHDRWIDTALWALVLDT